MTAEKHRFFGWNTNTDWTKCQSKDCIETIGVFAIDADAETNDFQNICNLSNMINSDRSSYDNGDISYGTTIEFFNEIINLELERDEKWWSERNNFHQMLTTEHKHSIGDVTISYKKDYFKIEFDGHMYTGMNFELVSESEGVEPCTVFFGSDETFYLEDLLTDDGQEVVTDAGDNIAIQKAYGAQSIFLAKTGPLDYKPFCDQSLQFGVPEPDQLLKMAKPQVIEKEEIEPEVFPNPEPEPEPEPEPVLPDPNIPPVIEAKTDTQLVNTDYVLDISTLASDQDGDTLTYDAQITEGKSSADLELNGSILTIKPSSDFIGDIVVRLLVFDGKDSVSSFLEVKFYDVDADGDGVYSLNDIDDGDPNRASGNDLDSDGIDDEFDDDRDGDGVDNDEDIAPDDPSIGREIEWNRCYVDFTLTTDASSQVKANNYGFYWPGHPMLSGTQVVYSEISGKGFDGFVDGRTYYVIRCSDDIFRLANTHDDAVGTNVFAPVGQRGQKSNNGGSFEQGSVVRISHRWSSNIGSSTETLTSNDCNWNPLGRPVSNDGFNN